MHENPLQFVTHSVEKISNFIQTNLSNLMDQTHRNKPFSIANKQPPLDSLYHSHSDYVDSDAIQQLKDTKVLSVTHHSVNPSF